MYCINPLILHSQCRYEKNMQQKHKAPTPSHSKWKIIWQLMKSVLIILSWWFVRGLIRLLFSLSTCPVLQRCPPHNSRCSWLTLTIQELFRLKANINMSVNTEDKCREYLEELHVACWVSQMIVVLDETLMENSKEHLVPSHYLPSLCWLPALPLWKLWHGSEYPGGKLGGAEGKWG